MEFAVLGLFCGILILCIVCNASIIYALLAGFAIFSCYAKKKGFSVKEILHMAGMGVWKVRNILITFILIGMLTALWRQAGTIPAIICYTIHFIKPSVFLLMVFLLNCLVSVLTGTSFGTAATVGVVCATMGTVLEVSPWLCGGAILSGIFFGDRCSPVSTSALLVSELTETSIYRNIRNMIRSARIPFVLVCILYAMIGIRTSHTQELPDLSGVFHQEFKIVWWTILPAIVILILSVAQLGVKISMIVSIAVALGVCIWVQGVPVTELPHILVFGFHGKSAEISSMLDGGGIVSMLKVGGIVCLSSSYSGIFEKTGILDRIQKTVEALAEKTFPFLAILLTSVATSAIACNQTLAIILTQQLCARTERDKERLANGLEDSVVILAPMIPWSIAGAVPLAAVGAPQSSILFAFFLYLLPISRVLQGIRRKG